MGLSFALLVSLSATALSNLGRLSSGPPKIAISPELANVTLCDKTDFAAVTKLGSQSGKVVLDYLDGLSVRSQGSS